MRSRRRKIAGSGGIGVRSGDVGMSQRERGVLADRGGGQSGDPVKVIPLGGLGEVGMNMMVVESGRDLVVIDAGVKFPENSTPGVERIVPNMEYVSANSDRLRGILITHGHLDHIGAIPNLLEVAKAPIYAPRLAADLVNATLSRQGRRKADVRVIDIGMSYGFGSISAEWLEMCHSIPDACSIYLTTRQGGIFHSGDFKLDDSPTLGAPTDYVALCRVADRGVRLLLSDSTNAMVPGHSGSDAQASDAIYGAISGARGRVIVASFSTQLARVQMVANACAVLGRKLAIVGRGMRDTTALAERSGHLKLPPDVLISVRDVDGYNDDEVVVMTTGTQGETEAGLVRMSRGSHRDVRLVAEDTVIMSSRTIPGNEHAVNGVVNDLARVGVKLITARDRPVHVSGHAARDELKLMLNLLRPDYFTPIHGEYRMLRAHCEIASEVGMRDANVNLITDGEVLELGPTGAKVRGQVPAGGVYIHGEGAWDADGTVVGERRKLARDGVVFVSIAVDESGVVGYPQLATSGFVDECDVDALMDDASEVLIKSIDSAGSESLVLRETKQLAKACLERFFSFRTRRRPLIMVTQIDLRDGQIFD